MVYRREITIAGQSPSNDRAERRAATGSGASPRSFNPALQLARVMHELAELMGSPGAILTLHPGDGAPAVLLFSGGGLAAADRDAMFATLASETRADFEDGCAFWREGADGRGAALYLMPVDRLAGHGRLVITMLLGRDDGDLRARAERLYRERRPFATGFFQLWQQNRLLEQRARSMESVLDQTAIALVLLDRTGRITFANQTAGGLLAIGEGIGVANGTLRAASLIDGVNLQAALAHAIGAGAAAGRGEAVRAPLLAFQRRGKPPLIASLLPARPAPVEANDVAAVMYMIDPQIDTAKMLAPLCRLYGLSVVETGLACHLAAGETIASAAQIMHVKEQTARSYLKTIFVKTATRRQTELVVLMLSSLIRMKQDVIQEALTSFDSAHALSMHHL